MNARWKWLQIFLDVVTYEVIHRNDDQLLSQSCDRLIAQHPVAGRAFILFVGTVLTLHLSNSIDDRVDLMSKRFWSRIL